MSEAVKFEDLAQQVLEQSCLTRRRLLARYKIGARAVRRKNVYIALWGSALIVLVWVIWRLIPTVPQEVISLSADLQAPEVKSNRFCFMHTVREGDTLWEISFNYYGAGTNENIEKLRNANPWLPEDPKALKDGKTIQIPLQEGGCNVNTR
jgi:phage tail protein X